MPHCAGHTVEGRQVRGITSGVSDPAEEIKSETRDGKPKEGLKNQ